MTGPAPRDAAPCGDVDELLRAAVTAAEKGAVLVRHLTESGLEPGWAEHLADHAEGSHVDLSTVRSVVSDLAWMERTGSTTFREMPRPAGEGDADFGSLRRRIAFYAGAQRLRFDFRFYELGDASALALEEFPRDAFLQAFQLFAMFGSRTPGTLDRIPAVLGQPNADFRVRHVCLHGLWVADELPDQAEALLGLAEEMISRGEGNDTVYYRRASALRKLGRFEEARASIDRAIALLPPGNNDLHQDYVREREAIGLARHVDDHAAHLSAQLETRLREITASELRQATDTISGSLLSIIEILGLFVAVVAFLFGSGTVILGDDDFSRKLVTIVVLVLGSVAFFACLRLVLTFRLRRQPGRHAS
jgi:hypothetical protein